MITVKQLYKSLEPFLQDYGHYGILIGHANNYGIEELISDDIFLMIERESIFLYNKKGLK